MRPTELVDAADCYNFCLTVVCGFDSSDFKNNSMGLNSSDLWMG
jgi:hypothetical protein